MEVQPCDLAVGGLIPHPTSISLKRKYLASGSAKSHQSLALAQFMHCHLPHDRTKNQEILPLYPHPHPPPEWCVYYSWCTDVGAGGVWEVSIPSSQSCSQHLPQTLKNRPRDTPVWVSSLWLLVSVLSARSQVLSRCTSQKAVKNDRAWPLAEWGVGLTSVCKQGGVWFHLDLTEAWIIYFIFCKIIFWCSRTLGGKNGHSKKHIKYPHSPTDCLYFTYSSKLRTTFLLATLHMLLPLLFVPHEHGWSAQSHRRASCVVAVECFYLLMNSSILSANGKWAILLTAESASGHII